MKKFERGLFSSRVRIDRNYVGFHSRSRRAGQTEEIGIEVRVFVENFRILKLVCRRGARFSHFKLVCIALILFRLRIFIGRT